MSDWQPIETAPMDYTEVLIDLGSDYGFRIRAAKYDRRRCLWVEKGSDPIDTPTHWQPLPAPPETPDA